jgi:hypothetical protein
VTAQAPGRPAPGLSLATAPRAAAGPPPAGTDPCEATIDMHERDADQHAQDGPGEASDPGAEFDWSWAQDDHDGWVPPAVDTSRPSVARIYDTLLGGKDNSAPDREAAQLLLTALPQAPGLARAHRDFVVTAVRHLARAGIQQFLDLGAGIPVFPAVHEVARESAPDARVVYVDNDPVVLAHLRAMIGGAEGVTALGRDLREPGHVLRDPRLRHTLNLREPVGLLCTGVLHFVSQSRGAQVLRTYLDRLAPGSMTAFSIASRDGAAPGVLRTLEAVYQSTTYPIVLRTRAQIEEFADGLDLAPPGLAVLSPGGAAGDAGLTVYTGIGTLR